MAQTIINADTFSGKLPSLKWVKFVVGGLVILFLFKSAVISVPAGYVGVVFDRTRGVLDTPMSPGFNLAIPILQKVTVMDTRLQEYTMSAAPDEGALRKDDSLDAPTSDGQSVKVDATVLYRIEGTKAPEIYKTIGADYTDKLIRPFSRSQIRMVISRYTAPAIYSEKRQEAETTMAQEIAELLKPKNIIIDKVLLRAVYFSDEYSKAIEDKVIAEQRVKQAEFEVQQATQTAQAKIAEARGLAEAQNLQKATLTQEYLQHEAIQKWNGILPSYLGTGSLPFLNLPVK
jgi:regulator of protease activity HflC (stomatin/prohibitin superfamily)